ncbi:MAG: glycosyltransferase family 2 protein [Halobacteriales archaeon]|nr:glycosyltransferase family 2 protein [Halobacteriales archaeon]
MPPHLSIAIVNFNSGHRLRQCLDALQRHPPSCPYEVLVVDNASTDGSAAFLANAPVPNVRLVPSPANLLFTGGVNVAHAEARGDLLLILNPDMVAQEGAFDALVRHMDADPGLGGIGGYTLTPEGRFEKYLNRFPTPYAVFLTRFVKGRRAERSPAHRRYHMVDTDFSVPQEVQQPAGGCLAVRRSLFAGQLLLDPAFGIYWSDVELAQKVWRSGHRILVFPDARFIHDHAARNDPRGGVLLNLDYLVGSAVYFRRYGGWGAAVAAKLLFGAGFLASLLLVRLPMALRGAEAWDVWRSRAKSFFLYLANRNTLLERARKAAAASGVLEKHPVL